MTGQEQVRQKGRLRQFLSDWWGWLAVILILLILIVVPLFLVWTGNLPTGLSDYTDPSGGFHRGKTLWDWMVLLLAPAVIGIFASLFSWALGKRQRETQEQLARAQREAEKRQKKEQQRIEVQRIIEQRAIELDRSREASLQTYFDRMTDLVGRGLVQSEPGDPNRSIARSRTLTALRQLDGERKGLLLRFLYEVGLIGEEVEEGQEPKEEQDLNAFIVDLFKADLSDADLSRAYLSGAVLVKVNLTNANLSEAHLTRADLLLAKLNGADLSGAYLGNACLLSAFLLGANLSGAQMQGSSLQTARLREANLEGANLSGADLMGANLQGANLSGANLEGANLVATNLEGARVMPEQLAQAEILFNTTMPDGTTYPS